jgi:hypothetical protein
MHPLHAARVPRVLHANNMVIGLRLNLNITPVSPLNNQLAVFDGKRRRG